MSVRPAGLTNTNKTTAAPNSTPNPTPADGKNNYYGPTHSWSVAGLKVTARLRWQANAVSQIRQLPDVHDLGTRKI